MLAAAKNGEAYRTYPSSPGAGVQDLNLRLLDPQSSARGSCAHVDGDARAHASMGANSAPRQVKIRKVYRMRINKRKLLNRVRVVAILLLLMAANILVQAMLAQTQHRLAMVRGEIKELEKEIGRLQYDLAYLGSSERIEVVAVNTLGMKPVENEGRQLLAYAPELPETPEITLFMQAPGYPGMERGVLQRVAGWLSGVGRAMAVPGY